MELWITLIAVLGTLGGASLGPLFATSNRRADARAEARAKRETAVGELVLALLQAGLIVESETDEKTVRDARDRLHRAQISVSLCLGKGEGPAETYIAGVTRSISLATDADTRHATANKGGHDLLRWMREELATSELRPFSITLKAERSGFTFRTLEAWPHA